MGIDISVLMGANIANEVAAEKFCETTIGELWGTGPGPLVLSHVHFPCLRFHGVDSPLPLHIRAVDLRVGILCKEALVRNWSVSATSRMKGKPRGPFWPDNIIEVKHRNNSCLCQRAGDYVHGGAPLAVENHLFFTHRCQYLDHHWVPLRSENG